MSDRPMAQAIETPWQPIFTIERSGITEVVIWGIISIVKGTPAGQPQPVLSFGQTETILWSRSCLKAWQLLSHFDELKQNYPDLKPEHLAMMMSSHSAEALHLKLLKEILSIGQVSDTMLRCPATYPLSAEMKIKLTEQGEQPRSLYHNCSGKHLGYLLSMKAEGLDLADYLNPLGKQFEPLKELLSDLVGRSPQSFPVTTDGCQLPNYGLTVCEMAMLYQGLSSGRAASQTRSSQLAELAKLMQEHPFLIGGTDRLDSLLMAGRFSSGVPIVAKGGADGLLGVGVAPCLRYKNGLGILVKIASGYESRYLEMVVKEIFRQLGLLSEKPERAAAGPSVRKDHIKTVYNFEIAANEAARA